MQGVRSSTGLLTLRESLLDHNALDVGEFVLETYRQ